ncbi:MAG: hypothetical protein RR382_00610 [Tannerellaceae bacterium]
MLDDDQTNVIDVEVIEQPLTQKKVGILYICTGKYSVFWGRFYKSFEKNFLPGYEKHYFVFTDKPVDKLGSDRVKNIYQKNLPWPGPTLSRFDMFLRVQDSFADMDYLFFLNSNLVCAKEVTDVILPDEGQICAPLHAQFCRVDETSGVMSAIGGPHDTNPESSAYIPNAGSVDYIMGGVNGGHTKDYLDMCRECSHNVSIDAERGVVALRHDESHLNRYALAHPVKKLSPKYLYPEGWDIPFDAHIICLDKEAYGGHSYMRSVVPFAYEKCSQYAYRYTNNDMHHYLESKAIVTARQSTTRRVYDGYHTNANGDVVGNPPFYHKKDFELSR